MRKLFKDLQLGDKFHNGKSYGMGANSNILKWLEFEKISKSQAKVINQVNYSNTRLVGTIQSFGANCSVFDI